MAIYVARVLHSKCPRPHGHKATKQAPPLGRSPSAAFSQDRMKRAQDKIKDLVEPQAFDELLDVAADPSRALAAYRFTDVTSDLLARWLDALADLPRGQGTARARSEEHTSELQSRQYIVCRLLL